MKIFHKLPFCEHFFSEFEYKYKPKIQTSDSFLVLNPTTYSI
jgi:hypothetical protein